MECATVYYALLYCCSV